MKYSMLKTFGSKYHCHVSKIKERFVKKGIFTVQYGTRRGTREATFYHEGFHRKTQPSLGQVDVREIYKKYSRPNSLAARLKANYCELCGAQCTQLEMHQVKRLKDLTGTHDWERMMKE